MFWVLQKNLFNEAAFEELLRQLDTQDTKYEVVNIIPFAHEMEPDINPDGPIKAFNSQCQKIGFHWFLTLNFKLL